MPSTIITCPNCNFSKEVQTVKLPANAAKITCPQCKRGFDYTPVPIDTDFLFGSETVSSESPTVVPPDNTKPCRFCRGQVHQEAIKCKHCGAMLNEFEAPPIPIGATKPCPLCQEPIHPDAIKCKHCGSALDLQQNLQRSLEQPFSQSQVQFAPVVDDEASKIFIGKNYEYFRRTWEIAAQKNTKQTFSWSAFLGGFAWMAYRKMYLYSWIFIGAVVIESLCEYAFNFPDKLSNAINFGISATFGWQGNYWYKLHVEKKLREIAAANTPEQAKLELVRQGGTSVGAAIGFVGVFILIIILLVFVAARE